MVSIRKSALIAVSVATMAFSFGAMGASAQPDNPVGTPGDPQCHGERVSTGNHKVEDIPGVGDDFRLTPKGRTELLNTFHVDGRTDWTVQDFQNRVRTSCEAP